MNEEVTASVALHIPPNVSKDYIKSEIVDMSVIRYVIGLNSIERSTYKIDS